MYSFFYKNGKSRYKYLVYGRESSYFVLQDTDSKSKYAEDDIINMLEFTIDSIFVTFGKQSFQQTIGIPMETNCAPFLADLFLYSYESEFLQSLLRSDKKTKARSFNFTYIYTVGKL